MTTTIDSANAVVIERTLNAPVGRVYARKNFEVGRTAIIGTELKQFVEKREKGKS